MNNWFLGTPAGKYVSMAVDSTGNPYDIEPGRICVPHFRLGISHLSVASSALSSHSLTPRLLAQPATGLVYSFPVTCAGGKWSIVPGLALDDFAKEKLKATQDELVEEKTMAFSILEGK